MLKFKKHLLASSLIALSTAANAGYEVKLSDDNKLIFGGFIKADARYVDGNVGYRDFWIGAGTALPADATQFKMFVNESRINTKYIHGDVTGFVEMDFYGGGGNEVISNSVHPRLRHAFIKYKDITVGQTWTTFMNTSALAETADFAGAMVGEAFVRNGQIRYTKGGLQVSLENPESYGGDTANDDMPDVTAKYTFKGDWGNVSVAGLFRSLNTLAGDSETALGFSVAGRIKTTGKDDFRFQLHQGQLGRYVGVAAAKDIEATTQTTDAGDITTYEVEESTAYMVAYRHFWNESTRSSVFYGNITTEESDVDRTQWGINVFKNYTKNLSFGAEIGNFSLDEQDADSTYLQFSAKYVL